MTPLLIDCPEFVVTPRYDTPRDPEATVTLLMKSP